MKCCGGNWENVIHYAQYFLKYLVFLYIPCYIAEILIACLTVYTYGTVLHSDGKMLLQLSSFPRSRPIACPACPLQWWVHGVQILCRTFCFFSSMKWISFCTIVWTKTLCSFLQTRVCLGLKHFFQWTTQWTLFSPPLRAVLRGCVRE